MTDAGRVRVTGADRVARTMSAAAADLETMDTATRAYGRLLAGTAQDYAPVRTGRLRASIGVTATGVSATAPYAGYVEYGNPRRGVRAVRFMARAVDGTEQAREQLFTRDAQHITDQIKGA